MPVLTLSEADARAVRDLQRAGEANPYRPWEEGGARSPQVACLEDCRAELYYGQQPRPGARRLVVWSKNGLDPQPIAATVLALWYGDETAIDRTKAATTGPGCAVFDWAITAVKL